MEINTAKQTISKIAAGNGFKILNHQTWSMSFQKGEDINRVVINVYWNKNQTVTSDPKFTIQTALNHPKKGRKQYNRKDVDVMLIEKIFANPRLHTKELGVKGYFKK